MVSPADLLLARTEVLDAIARLARAQDAKDWDAVAGAYLDAATYVHPGGRLEGVEAILDRTRSALASLDASQHLIGTVTVDLAGDHAHSVAYFHAQHVRVGAPGGDLYTVGGTYTDLWWHTPAGWRIATRTQTYQWRSGNRDVVAR